MDAPLIGLCAGSIPVRTSVQERCSQLEDMSCPTACVAEGAISCGTYGQGTVVLKPRSASDPGGCVGSTGSRSEAHRGMQVEGHSMHIEVQ